jgi:hypothetical protein
LSDIAAFDTVTGRRNWARSGLCDCALSFTEAQKCKVGVVGNGPNSNPNKSIKILSDNNQVEGGKKYMTAVSPREPPPHIDMISQFQGNKG